MRKAGVLLLGMLLLVSLALTGCSEDKATSTSVATPTASTLNPTGTIQGRLLDKVTQQPIAGAVIAIGVANATTDANGQFVLANIPATQGNDMDGNGVTSGSYEVTINMLGVTSPVSMATATVNKYAKHYIKNAYVEYASLNDSGGSSAGSGAGTNHDTVLTGLVATADFKVGKMSASIAGEVGGCANTASFLTSVGAGYTVKVVASATSDNSGTGALGNVIGTTTTTATGFQFTGLEAGTTYTIYAESADHLMRSNMAQTADTRGDGEVTYLLLQESTALHVCPVDTHGPYVTAVSPEPLSDLSTIGTTTVTITFNEAVAQTAYTTTTGGPVANLFDDIEVVYAGMKAGNIPYTLAWAAGNTQLQIAFTTGVSGKYYVRILDIDGGNFKDANNQNADMGICKDDSAAPAAYGIAANAGANDCTVYFTTSGAPTASAVTNLVWVNDGLIDTAGQATLDWTAISGAKKYNVYRRKNQIWGATTINHDYIMIDESTGSFYADGTGPDGIPGTGDDGNLPMVENNEIKLTYDYMVRAVNSDGLESGNSNVVTVSDKIGPQLNITAATFRTDLVSGDRQLNVVFNEAMDETTVINAANWLFSSSTITSTAVSIQRITYNAGANTATLWFNNDIPLAGIARTEIIAGANGVFEGTAAVTDGQLMPNGVVSGGVCVTPNSFDATDLAGDTLTTAVNAADAQFHPANSPYTANSIFSGASGTCDSGGALPGTVDTQVVASGSVTVGSSLVGISAATWTITTQAGLDGVAINNTAADFVLGTTPAALDAVNRKIFITLDTTAVRDVAGNLIKTTTTAPTNYGNRVNTDGTMTSN